MTENMREVECENDSLRVKLDKQVRSCTPSTKDIPTSLQQVSEASDQTLVLGAALSRQADLLQQVSRFLTISTVSNTCMPDGAIEVRETGGE